MHHSPDSIATMLDANEAAQHARNEVSAIARPVVGMVSLDLEPGDSAWHPASTKHDVHGPLRVTYRRYPDGAVEVESESLAKFRETIDPSRVGIV